MPTPTDTRLHGAPGSGGCEFGLSWLVASAPSLSECARSNGPTVCDQTADAVCLSGDSKGFADDKTTAVINSASHSLLLPQLSPRRAGLEPALSILGCLEQLSRDGMWGHATEQGALGRRASSIQCHLPCQITATSAKATARDRSGFCVAPPPM